MNKKQKEIEDIADKIINIYKTLSTTDTKTILKQYKTLKIAVYGDELKSNLALYNHTKKSLVLSKWFTNGSRDEDELAYILLHCFYYVMEDQSTYIKETDSNRSYGDFYAKYVFNANNKPIPTRFEYKEAKQYEQITTIQKY